MTASVADVLPPPVVDRAREMIAEGATSYRLVKDLQISRHRAEQLLVEFRSVEVTSVDTLPTVLPTYADTSADPVDTRVRLPWVVWVGMAVVLIAAAVLSFAALRDLALAVGIDRSIAWLMPIVVDAGAAVTTAVWLGGRSPADAAAFARAVTLALLATTVLGNAGQLGMHANGITPPWWVAAIVGAIAPAVVYAVVHTVVLIVRRP